MALTAIYRDEATGDIADAILWYRDQKKGLEENFIKAVLACEAFIEQYPKGAPVIHKHLRQIPLKGFPYVMIYGVWHSELVIYRLFHTSQHPKKKFARNK